MISEKLKDPPIVEVMLDVRFEPNDLPEVVIGRLSGIQVWPNMSKSRLPTADLPAALRAMNPQLKYLPSLELSDAGGANKVRIGANVISVHFVGQYTGWEHVFPTMETVIDGLFQTLPGIAVVRLALRYVNLFTGERHTVRSVNDLALKILVAGVEVNTPVNVLLSYEGARQHKVMTRVASRGFMQGNLPPGLTAAIDVDVSTPDGYSNLDSKAVKQWIDEAHTLEKKAFRNLLPDALYEKLKETVDARTTH